MPTRTRYALLTTLILVGMLALSATPAFAATVYSEMSPAPGSVVAATTVPISVKVIDPTGINYSVKVQVDGRSISGKYNFQTNYLTATATGLTAGTHTAFVSVLSGARIRTSTTWTFTVRMDPVLSAPVPAQGAIVSSLRPDVSAAVSLPGGTPMSSVALTIDGVAAPAVWNAPAGRIVWLKDRDLADGVVHDVRFTAINTAGASGTLSSSFEVQVYPDMAQTDCTSCHPTYPLAHDMASECLTCHSDPDDVSPIGFCAGCHNTTPHSAELLQPFSCELCHQAKWTYRIANHDVAPATYHVSSTDTVAGCACHSRSLTREHARRTDDSGVQLTCATCHSSTDPAVVSAIAGGETACLTCHANASGHESLHEVERTDSCADCHDGENLIAVHVTGGDLTCADCHESEDAEVVAAIAAGDLTCDACHTAQGTDYHLNMAVHYAPESYEECGHCHHGWGSSPVRGPDVTRHAGGCTTCHNDTLDLTGLTTKCVNCHDTEGVNRHANTAVVHTPLDSGSLDCARCHTTTDVRELHVTQSCTTCHVTYGCSECHSLHNGSPGTPLLTGLSCSNCHTTPGANYHADFDTDHTFGDMDGACQGAGCHSDSLVTAHSALVGEGGRYPEYSDTCALCHLNEDPDRVPEGATADCSSCHEGHGDLGAVHTASPAAESVSILGTSFGSHACSECHSLDLRTLHVACGTCHPTPVNTAMPYSGGCVQGGCHAAGSSAPKHASLDTAHVTGPQTCTAVGCHSGGTNVAAIHQNQGCVACHGAGITPSTACVMCHDLDAPHGNDRAIHQSTISTGDVRLFDNHDGMGPLDYGVECTWCHGTNNLLDVHNDNCTICHTGPRATFTTWNKSCQQSACHPSYHTGASAGHQDEYYSSDCETWCHDYDWGVPPQNCGGCHTFTDTAAPTTGSNAAASYLGMGVVNLTISDPFPTSGIAHTYYKIDGGAQAEGTQIRVPGPTSGSAVHTVEYWSIDNSGNTESPHKSKTFTLTADTAPPETTSNAKSAYTGPAVITFTATDNGSAGVKATYYTVDGGAAQTGTVVTIAQPVSGTVAHTVQFWSVDWSNNTEGVHTASLTSGVDSAAPTTTQTGITTWVRSTRPLVTLNAVDTGDAGVVASYAQVDGVGTLYGGASTGSLRIYPYALQGMHTLTYWSVDSVGNTETKKSVSYGTDYASPVTSITTQNSYYGQTTINWTASDNLSGVNTAYYRLDSGVTQTGTSVTIPPPTTGSPYHILQVWATDNAGNTSSPVYRYFYVYALAADTTPPAGTMSVNNGALYTTVQAATVNSAMTDTGTGMSQMRIDPGTGAYGSWIAYGASSAITLPAGNGTKTVRAEYRDVAGNVAAKTDTIMLDSAAPTGTMSVNNGAAITVSTAVTVNSSVSDANSGMYQMRIDPGTGTYGSWIGYAASQPALLPTGDGVKTVNVQYKDNAGNTMTLTDTIELQAAPDTTPPTTTSNALTSYTGPAVITLTATDNLGGVGVQTTYYKLDGGAQTAGITINVAAPASSSVGHSIEFWSVDKATNEETPHKTASFTVAAPPPTGTITLMWDAPTWGDPWAEYWIYDADGALVAYASSDTIPGWDGWYTVTVPVSARPYHWYSEWYDPEYDYGDSSGDALIDTPGKAYSSWY